MFRKLSKGSVALIEKYLPDAYLFAAFLTILTFILGILFTGQGPMDMIIHWGNGFWKLLAFAMQMALVVVTGYVLADTAPIRALLRKLARIPKTPKQGIALVSVVSTIAFFLNWGFGLVVGAILARRVAGSVENIDYRLLIATSYSSIAVWHGGISGSIPLKMNTASAIEQLTVESGGVITQVVPTGETIFAGWNLILQLALLIILCIVHVAMHPTKQDTVSIDPKLLEEEKHEPKPKNDMSPAEKMENSMILTVLIGLGGLAYIIHVFRTQGFNLSLDLVNFIFLIFGIILHKNPRNFLDSVAKAASATAGVLIQFPFYAGIMGMMVGAPENGMSLAQLISRFFVNISSAKTFPIFTYLSAGIVNFFVPSGGGQWAVQAPIMMPAGQALGVSPAITGMAIAYGDAWTNLIQPFWALPALGVANLSAKDIMGYCLIALFAVGIVTLIGFAVLL